MERVYSGDAPSGPPYQKSCGRYQRCPFALETKGRRLQKSLSDLGGTDVYIHGGRPRGVFRELCNALVRAGHQPTVEEMTDVYRGLVEVLPEIKERAGAKSAFEARVFADLIVTARALAGRGLAC